VPRLVWAYGRHVNRTVENLGTEFAANGYDLTWWKVEVPRWRKLGPMLSTLHIDARGRLAGFSAHHPAIVRAARIPRHLAEVPVFSVRDIIVNSAPHFFYQDLSYSAVVAQRIAGIRTFTYDDVPLGLLKRRAEVQQEHYERACVIFVFSHWIRQKILALNGLPPEKVRVVGAGSNLGPPWRENPYGDRNLARPRVLFVGRDWTRKGGPLLLQAWTIVRKAVPEAELHLVGAGTRLTNRRLGVVGYPVLPPGQLRERFLEASLFVVPTLWEAYGVVFVEAMSAGIPVVGPRRMAVPEIVRDGETGYLVDQDEPELYAERIIALLRDQDRLIGLSRAAFARSKQFTWSKVFAGMESAMRPYVQRAHAQDGYDVGTS